MLRMLVTLGIVVAIFSTIMITIHGMTLAMTSARTVQAMRHSLDNEQSSLLRYERIRVSSASPPPDAPTVPQTCAVHHRGNCVITISVEISILPELTGDVRNEQSNALIDEHRVAYRLLAVARKNDGTIIARRSRVLALRVFRVAPYVTLAASRDTTTRTEGSGAADDGGTAPTTVHIRYRNVTTGASFSGDIFTQASAPPAPPSWSN